MKTQIGTRAMTVAENRLKMDMEFFPNAPITIDLTELTVWGEFGGDYTIAECKSNHRAKFETKLEKAFQILAQRNNMEIEIYETKKYSSLGINHTMVTLS